MNPPTADSDAFPSVAADSDGDFVVVWFRGAGYGFPRDLRPALQQRGMPLGGEFRVDSLPQAIPLAPSVASDADGNFVVAWSTFAAGSGYKIFGQRYDSAGVPQGGAITVAPFTAQRQDEPSVASDPSGNFVVAWQKPASDGSGDGVLRPALRQRRCPPGRRVPDQHFHHRQSVLSVCGGDRHQSVRRGLVVGRPGRRRDGAFGQRFDFTGGPTIHVGDLDRKAKNVGATWRAQVKTTVHDNGHLAESGVLVTFNVSAGVGTRTCTTTGSGVCEVSVVVGDAVPSLTFTVTSLSKTGFSYNARGEPRSRPGQQRKVHPGESALRPGRPVWIQSSASAAKR